MLSSVTWDSSEIRMSVHYTRGAKRNAVFMTREYNLLNKSDVQTDNGHAMVEVNTFSIIAKP